MDMIRTTSTQLKAKLGSFLRAVRDGQDVVITDRGRPVARLVPFEGQNKPPPGIRVARPRDPSAPPLGEVEVVPIRYEGRSTTEILLEDRARR